jgi:uncharacterized protein (TIGR02246 family)
LTDAERQAIIKEIQDRTTFWNGAANSLDALRGMQVHLPDPDFMAATQGSLWRNQAECLNVIRPYMARLKSQQIHYNENHIKVLSPDIAVQACLGTISATDTTGITSAPVPYALTAVWVKRDGKWYVLQFHQSTATGLTL